jgi:lysophospholipase L1-like esterase
MKVLFKILFLLLFSSVVKAQNPAPSGLPSPYSTGYYRIGWIQSDSGLIDALRDTTIRSKYPGLRFLWQHIGLDTSEWFYNGKRYIKTLNTQDTLPGRFVVTPSYLNSQGYLKNITGLIQQGSNVTISGSGTLGSPYVINSSGGGGGTDSAVLAGLWLQKTVSGTNIIINSDSGAQASYFLRRKDSTLYATQTQLSSKIGLGSLSASPPILYNNSTGVFSEQVANTSQNGYLTSTDWNTFNGKQAALSGTGYLKFSGTTPSYLTPTQATADLNLFTTSLQGLTPASGGGTTNFLRADGTWAAPPGGGGSGTVTTFSAGTLSPLFTTSVANATTTPALTFTLSTASANTAFGNFTGSTATPSFGKVPVAAFATGTANTLLGYDGSGNPSAITAGTNISISGGIINATGGTFSNPMTTNGDMIYQVGGTYGRLAVAPHPGMKLTSGASGAINWLDTTAAAGTQNLTYTQNALNNNLAISGGNNQNFLTATHSLAGLMDTASKAVDDSLRNRTYAYPAFSNYPLQQPFGEVYSKTTWPTGAADFSVAAAGTASISFTGAVPTITSTSINWSNTIALLPSRPTLLNNWSDTLVIQLNFTPGAGTTGTGPAIITVPTEATHADNSVKIYLNTSTSSNGALTMANSAGTPLATGSGCTNTLNDVIQFVTTLKDSVLTCTATNLTTSVTATCSKTFTTAISGPFIPNTANWGHIIHGTGTYKILKRHITSQAIRYPNILGLYDSKGFVGASTFAGSVSHQLNALFPTYLYYSDGGGTTTELLAKKSEVLSLDGETILFEIGCNDIRYGVSLAQTVQNITTIANWFKGTSTRFLVTIIPEDSTAGGVGLTALKNWEVAYFGSNYIDSWTTMTGGSGNIISPTLVSSDGIHPNQAGHNAMEGILAPFLSTIDLNRRAAYRTYGQHTTPIGDSLSYDYKQELRAGYINYTNDSNNVVPSMMQQVGYTNPTAYLSVNPNQTTNITPISGTVLATYGRIGSQGPSSGIIIQDATTPTTYMFLGANAGYGFINGNGVSYNYFQNNSGDEQMTNGSVNTSKNFGGLLIKKNKTFSANTPGNAGSEFTLDSATITLNSTGPWSGVGQAGILSNIITSATAQNVTRSFGLYIEAPTSAGSATLLDNNALVIGTGRTELGVATAGRSSLNIPSSGGTNVTSPVSGDLWWNGTNLDFRTGSTTVDLLAGSGGATNIGSTQNATSYSLTSSTGTGTTLAIATTSLAGLLDTARAKYIDSARGRLITSNLFAANGLTAAAGDSFYLGGTLNQTTTLATGGNLLKFTGLVKATTATLTTALVRNATDSSLAQLALASGSYTPSLTNTTNITSSNLTQAYYTRVGNIVHVMISGTFAPTLAATATVLTVSLPFTTSVTAQLYCGVGSIGLNSGTIYTNGLVSVNSGTTATLNFISGATTTTANFSISFDITL